MAVLYNNANRDFMHLIWKIYYYELVTGMEKDIHVSHKGRLFGFISYLYWIFKIAYYRKYRFNLSVL
jgi:hypothetical protein